MAWREDDRGRGYDDGAATGASATVGNSEGERQGGNGMSRGFGVQRGGIQASRGAGGKQVAPWRAQARRRHLPVCLAGKKQLAGARQHSAGPPSGPAGELAGLRQVSFSLFFFSVFLIYSIISVASGLY